MSSNQRFLDSKAQLWVGNVLGTPHRQSKGWYLFLIYSNVNILGKINKYLALDFEKKNCTNNIYHVKEYTTLQKKKVYIYSLTCEYLFIMYLRSEYIHKMERGERKDITF